MAEIFWAFPYKAAHEPGVPMVVGEHSLPTLGVLLKAAAHKPVLWSDLPEEGQVLFVGSWDPL